MKKRQLIKYLFLAFYLFFIQSSNSQKKEKRIIESKKDSISIWIKKSKNPKTSLSKREQYLNKGYYLIISNEIDSKNLKKLSDIAYQTFKLQDTSLFKKRNEQVLKLALKIKDSFSIGDAHWNYATYYNRVKDYESSYYHFNEAEKYFKSHKYYVGKMLVGKSFVKGRFSDYVGSELDIIKAIKIFKELKKYNDLLNSYTSLGVIQSDLKLYDKALFYYSKALKYSSLSKDKNKISLNNNIGLIYLKKGNYKLAITYLKKDLNHSLKKNNPYQYARNIDNLAYCKLLNNDTLGIKKDFYISLFIRDSLKNKEGVLTSKIHLSKYYEYLNDTIIAHFDNYITDTLWVITKPLGVSTLEIGNDIITSSPFMGIYEVGEILNINATTNGTNFFNQWNLSGANLPDYNANTSFILNGQDTLYAYFNNILSFENLGEDISSLNIYPSLVENYFTIEINANESNNLNIALYNLAGQKINNLFEGKLNAKQIFKERFEINLNKGIYLVEINTNKTSIIQKIVIAK